MHTERLVFCQSLTRLPQWRTPGPSQFAAVSRLRSCMCSLWWEGDGKVSWKQFFLAGKGPELGWWLHAEDPCTKAPLYCFFFFLYTCTFIPYCIVFKQFDRSWDIYMNQKTCYLTKITSFTILPWQRYPCTSPGGSSRVGEVFKSPWIRLRKPIPVSPSLSGNKHLSGVQQATCHQRPQDIHCHLTKLICLRHSETDRVWFSIVREGSEVQLCWTSSLGADERGFSTGITYF